MPFPFLPPCSVRAIEGRDFDQAADLIAEFPNVVTDTPNPDSQLLPLKLAGPLGSGVDGGKDERVPMAETAVGRPV
jgi:hypothetical protein